jgi:hypothetical protein
VATAADEGLVWIWDDDAGAVAELFGIDATSGAPVIGHRPVALAVDQPTIGDVPATIYVAAFADHAVAMFSFTKSPTPWSISAVTKIGGVSP